MAFNGSGTFLRLYSWVNDAAANIKIRADRMDNEMNGMAVGLSTCITKDGQTTITNNLPMASFRHTSVGNAASRTDYASFGQVQDGKAAWADGGGTADAITATYSIPITALVDGQLCYVRATAANATTTPTFSPNALTARTIVKNGGQPLAAGDIGGDGHELELRYDLTNTRWELMNPKQQAISIITPAQGGTGIANNAAATVTSSGNFAYTRTLTGTTNVTFPTTGTLATRAGIETLTNKTVGTVASTTSAAALNLPHGTAPTSPVNGDVWTTTSGILTRINGTTVNLGITLATPQATTSGTSIDFTGIPAGVKEISICFVGVSTNGTDALLVQLGDSGGVENTGYLGACVQLDASSMATTNYTAGFGINNPTGGAASVRHGVITLTLSNATNNTWCASGTIGFSNAANASMIAGSKSTSAVLDRVRITTVGGANTFDAGEINITYSW